MLDTFDRLKGLEVDMTENAKLRPILPDAFNWEAVATSRGGRSASQVAAILGLPDRWVRAWIRWA